MKYPLIQQRIRLALAGLNDSALDKEWARIVAEDSTSKMLEFNNKLDKRKRDGNLHA